MIALLISTSLVAGTVLGWFGYKATLRIQAWGRNMNEQDRIFQEAMPEASVEPPKGHKRPGSDAGAVPALVSHHLPLGAVGSK